MKKIFLLGIILSVVNFWSNSAFAQAPTGYYVDAAKFSQPNIVTGTARYQGFAGAGTSLGADLSTTSLNPAGLGMYRRSDIGISSSLGFVGATSNFLNQETRDSRGFFYLPNFGIAISNAKDDLEEGLWRGGTWGITYSKSNSFQSQVMQSGVNNRNSMIQSFIEMLNKDGRDGTQLGDVDINQLFDIQELVYMGYLSEYDTVERTFFNPFDSTLYYNWDTGEEKYIAKTTSFPTYQEQIITNRGGQNQLDFSYGGNVGDKLYFGAGLGVVFHKFITSKVFYEEPDSSGLENYTFSQDFTTKGTGVNFKIGLIYRPIDAIRLGVSVQTPTAFSLTESYRYSLVANYTSTYVSPTGFEPGPQNLKTIPLEYQYRLTTPAIFRGGISWLIGKRGFITADVDYIPYNTIKLRDAENPRTLNGDNRLINESFKAAYNVRLGGELRINIFRLRAGFASANDPLKNLVDVNTNRYTYTGGLGLRIQDFYVDFALARSQSKGIIVPYTLESGMEPVGTVNYRNTTAVLTIGTQF